MPIQMIAPKPIDLNHIRTMVDAALSATMTVVKLDFDLTTGSWESESKPKWDAAGPQTVGRAREMRYVTESTPFTWVDRGTKGPYPIPKVPKMKGTLAFQTGFVAKTIPRQIGSRPGGSFGPWAFPKQVMHPGITPREFSIVISEEATGNLVRNMFVALGKI